MSSRALRKLQRLQEEQQQQQQQQQQQDQRSAESDSGEESDSPVENKQPVFNAFDLLNAGGEEDENYDDDENEEEDEQKEEPQDETTPTRNMTAQSSGDNSPPTSTSAGKKKKKKKNKKGKKNKKQDATKPAQDPALSGVDEIDRALNQLSTNDTGSAATAQQQHIDSSQNDDSRTLCELLSVDTRSLNAINEMKKLFGNIVLQNESSTPQNRRSGRSQQRVALDLGTALTGRFSPASHGKDFSGAALRKNVLMQSKDEWPRAPSGGLGMEIVEKRPTGSTVYRLIYNAAYRDVQLQFEMAVASMQPEALIQHLQFNPYHLSTLLQVSEIAKHQGDHAVAADLLERALFNIGRSVHSSFSNLLKEGRARLSFRRRENREVWLTVWRYILNLGMKGTWRTAYEWAKLLLSLQPDDPYCISLMIDGLAIRGRQQKHFIDLCTHPYYKKRWNALPNIQCTLALAYLISGIEEEYIRQLKKVIARYPWIFCRLAQEFNIDPIPKMIWGAQPPNDGQRLFTELYMERAKDLWNRPEALALIRKVASSMETTIVDIETPEITLAIARHVILSDCRSAITYIPRHYVSGQMSASDPLPPDNDETPREQASSHENAFARLLNNNEGILAQLGIRPQANPARHNADIFPVEGEADMVREPILQESEDASQVTDWLMGSGLRRLKAFLDEYGIDPGNWELVDVEPFTDWVMQLQLTDRSNWGTIIAAAADQLGSPLVAELLQDELSIQLSE
ncbi:hypothetical protein KEM56_001843 [Ascosphaera pollenicola]|nr:hypothetical protein KEM56_001843 [Ascosphaera pollenicola]